MMMNKTVAPFMKWLYVLTALALLCVFVGLTLVHSQHRGGASALPDHITLTWTGNPAASMTITWRTDTTVRTGIVEYQKGNALSTAAKRVNADSSNFTTDIQATRLFSATLTGLSPNTRYSYRVGDGSRWSKVSSFTTADPEAKSFKFLVFGDSQSPPGGNPPYSVWRNTVRNAYKANPDARFMVNVGDLVDKGQSGAHWNGWFAAAAGVIDRIPQMPVVGNHETDGSTDTKRPSYRNAQFKLPQNGPPGLKNQVYSYDYGPAHFVVLDSQQSEHRKYGNILAPQAKWLDADLAASKAKWKIAFFHKGPYSLKDRRSNQDIKKAFCPVFDRHHVDLVFNAHDHGISRTYPIKNGAIRSKPSEGTVYYMTGRSGPKTYSDIRKRHWNAFFYNPKDQPNYIVVEVTDTRLTVRAKKADGALIDTFTINK